MKTWERFVDFAHFIGGNWVADSDVTTNCNPANRDDVIGTYARGDAARVDEAVAAALAALDDWAPVSYTHLTLPTSAIV